jgi:hypothetical protein
MPTKCTPEVVDAVEENVENEPNTFLRHLFQQVNLSVETCRTVLKRSYIYILTAWRPQLSAGDQGKDFSESKML